MEAARLKGKQLNHVIFHVPRDLAGKVLDLMRSESAQRMIDNSDYFLVTGLNSPHTDMTDSMLEDYLSHQGASIKDTYVVLIRDDDGSTVEKPDTKEVPASVVDDAERFNKEVIEWICKYAGGYDPNA